jgi:hypothetical protein
MVVNFEKESTKFLFLLLIADFAFILIHIFYMNHFISSRLFSLEKDFGYAEVYQYIKELWIVALLSTISIKRKHIIYFAWALLFTYFLFDDSLRIHELFGSRLVHHFHFQPMFSLRAQDFGELCTSILFGSLLFIFIGISYIFSNHTGKQISKTLFILVLALVFFGIVVDMLHIAIPFAKPVFGLIEDGGEMLVMSIIVWYIFKLDNTFPTTK